MLLPFTIHNNGIFLHFKIRPIQPHGDRTDSGNVFHHCAPDLDVEVLIGSVAMGGKDIVAGPREIIDVPIKRLVVELAPRAADLPIVS